MRSVICNENSNEPSGEPFYDTQPYIVWHLVNAAPGIDFALRLGALIVPAGASADGLRKGAESLHRSERALSGRNFVLRRIRQVQGQRYTLILFQTYKFCDKPQSSVFVKTYPTQK